MLRDAERLRDILGAASKISKYLDGVDKPAFLATEILQDAVLLQVICVGEAAGRISDDLRNRHPEVEWDKIRGARNRAVHDYVGIDWHIVWVTASDAIPKLATRVTAILAADYPGEAEA